MKWTALLVIAAVLIVGIYLGGVQRESGSGSEEPSSTMAKAPVDEAISMQVVSGSANAYQGADPAEVSTSIQVEHEPVSVDAASHIGEPLDVDDYELPDSTPRHIGEWIDPDDLRDDNRTEVLHIGEPMSVDDDSSYRASSAVRHIGEPLPPPDEYYGGWSPGNDWRTATETRHIGEPMDVETQY